jgi:hypothetical protein
MIKRIRRNEIDEAKWNDLIAKHPSALPYAYTWYLDAVCEQWEALVNDDYSAVMPLPLFKKYFFNVVYQPNFCQQLGVFSVSNDEALVSEFYAVLKKHFFFYHLQQNFVVSKISNQQSTERPNFELQLTGDYDSLAQNFNSNTKRNIQKAKQAELTCSITENSFDEFLSFSEQQLAGQKSTVVENLLRALLQNHMLLIPVVKESSGSTVAANLMIKCANRIIHLIPIVSDEGRKNGAMHFLLSEVIRNFSEKSIVLDFEGSSVTSIAQFYKGFGAQEKPFLEVRKMLKA